LNFENHAIQQDPDSPSCVGGRLHAGRLLLTFYPTGPYLGRMSIRKRADREYSAHLQGTLDLLILRTLILGRQHGQRIARAIQQQSDDVLIVDHGSLYPALQRLEERGFVLAEWGISDNNRKARFYTLTRKGHKELVREESEWRRIVGAISRVLGPVSTKA
jgi:PadR family transcriptional regulator PadR